MVLHKAWEPTILAGSQVIWGARGSTPLVWGLWAVTLEPKPSMALKIFVPVGRTSGMVGANASSLFDKGDRYLVDLYNPEQSNSSFTITLQT